MKNNKEKLTQFNESLKEKDRIIQKKLESFYEREYEREKGRMNSYGVATPKDRCLLKESASIQNLRKAVDSCNSFEELVKKLKEEIKDAKDADTIFDLERQLGYIDEYLKTNKNSSIIPDSTITDPQLSSKKDTLNSLFEPQISKEDNSNKMKR